MKAYTIAVLAGDGIGPEVMAQTLRVLDILAEMQGFRLNFREADVGGAAFEQHGVHLPEETVALCKQADAILFGSVGGPLSGQHLPRWKNCEANTILALRKVFSFGCNLRPVRVLQPLADRSPLKSERIRDGVDILIVRELLGDLYFGDHVMNEGLQGRSAVDTGCYTESLCRDALHMAFRASAHRHNKVTLVHKANVLAMSKLWVIIGKEVAREYPEVLYTEMLVDNCAIQLVLNPSQFDVIVTANLFGDILSDLASAIPGTLGLSPSASLNRAGFGLYEPAGGSAPDIAGKGIANPSAQILSAAMMLEYSFGLHDAATALRDAVEKSYLQGVLTCDVGGNASLEVFTEAVIQNLQ